MTRLTLALLIAAPFVAFYIPGLMILLGALAIGFNNQESREFTVIFGSVLGVVAFVATTVAAYTFWEDRK